MHAVLDRHGLVKRARMRKNRANGTPLSAGANPNDLWCTDFKGEFKLGNGRYCYPLTVSDHAARYLLLCEAFESTREAPVIEAFQRLFRDRGLPVAIRSDNGLPFASPNGLYNLSRLSVWWLRLGISIERIKPGHPQQNGRHERMHLTLKKEATRPPGLNSLQQQARFDAFVREFNAERPHEALAMRCPAELYTASPRPYDGLPELQYPWHDRDILGAGHWQIWSGRWDSNTTPTLARQRSHQLSHCNMACFSFLIRSLPTPCPNFSLQLRHGSGTVRRAHGRVTFDHAQFIARASYLPADGVTVWHMRANKRLPRIAT